MLNWRIVTKSLSSFATISFVLCVGYGSVAPSTLHAGWLLEALLPGFKWLSIGSFVLGLAESALYGAWAGILYSTLYNYFARRAGLDLELPARTTTRVVTLLLLGAVVATSSIAAAQAPKQTTPTPETDGRVRLTVTVQELIQRDHRMTVTAGTELLLSDPHFERVWFPSGDHAPRVERATPGFRAVFSTPGTYRGAFTIVGGHRSNDVYPLIVTVTER